MGTGIGGRAGGLPRHRGAGARVPLGGIVGLAVVVVGLAVVAFLVPVASPADVRAAEHEIVITDTGFEPDNLTVFVGEPVTWTNRTGAVHAIITADDEIDSGSIGPGGAFGHVFEEPGTVEYFEAGNPRVIGTIIVKPAPASASPAGAPTPSAASTPPASATAAAPSPSTPSPAASPPSPRPTATANRGTAVIVTTPAGGDSPALLLAVAVVGAIAVIATIAGLIGASRRPGR